MKHYDITVKSVLLQGRQPPRSAFGRLAPYTKNCHRPEAAGKLTP